MKNVTLLLMFLTSSVAWAHDKEKRANQSIIGKWENTRYGSDIVIDDSLELGYRYGSLKLRWRPLRLIGQSGKPISKEEAEKLKDPYFRGYYYGFEKDSHGYSIGYRRGRFTFYKQLAEVRVDPDGLLHISYWRRSAVGGGYVGETRIEEEYQDVYRRVKD